MHRPIRRADAADSRAPSLGFLLSPNAVLVVDLFRALGDFEDAYDLAALDQLEARLGRLIDPAAAQGVVSDALMLAFAVRRHREVSWEMNRVGSRRATLDEYRLVALVSA